MITYIVSSSPSSVRLLETSVLRPNKHLTDADEARQLFSPKKRSFSYSDLDKLGEPDSQVEKQKSLFEGFLATKNHFTFWTSLKDEIVGPYEPHEDPELIGKKEAVYNFVRVPLRLEKVDMHP